MTGRILQLFLASFLVGLSMTILGIAITTENIAVAVLSIIGTILTGWLGRRFLNYRKHYPFHVSIFQGRYEQESPETPRPRVLALPIGANQDIVFQATLLVEKEFRELNLRFVEWTWNCLAFKGWHPQLRLFKDASESKAEVISFKVIGQGGAQSTASRRRGTGQDYRYQKPEKYPEEDNLWLEAVVRGHTDWRGWISLQTIGSDRRAYGRHRIKFGNPPTWLERLDIRYDP